jgi:outer membrane lipoprotein-sorting protein
VRYSIAFFASLLLAPVVGGSVFAPRVATASAKLDPDQLLQRFRKIQGLEATYREEKRMALLAEPLVSEGTIHYARPGKLARHQIVPEKVSVIITGDALQFGGAHGQESVDLGRNPVVRLFVDSFVDVLAGDRGALEKSYTLGFDDQGDDRWKLRLKPTVAPMDKMIEGITMSGKGVVLESMEIVEVGGDSTRMVFTKVDPRRSYSKKEQREIFRIRK